MEEPDFDSENIMAEIKVATPEFVPFLAWCAENTNEDVDMGCVSDMGEIHPNEFKLVLELVYSYAKDKNDSEETRMIEGS